MSVAVAIGSRRMYARNLPVRIHLELLAAIILFAVLVFRIWIKIETTDLGYALASHRKEAIELDMQRRELELALSILQKGETIQSRASKDLGMVPMESRQARRM
jgi:cell division protein FtsL